ncbi:MAG: 50S ribosomal protein L18 [Nanoarchaeota archaeon]|nr:50S ribosomal protein L18 [Nanoarchaeota archaeon]
MATGPRYSVKYKRKRLNKTNYKKRLALLKSDKPRLVVRRTNKRVIVQLISFKPEGDKTIITVTNQTLAKHGWKNASNNLPSSYLTGYLAGKLALKNKIKEAVFDTGLNISSAGNNLYAVLAGAVESGLKIPHDAKVFPSPERMKGTHIKGFDSKIIETVKKSIEKV